MDFLLLEHIDLSYLHALLKIEANTFCGVNSETLELLLYDTYSVTDLVPGAFNGLYTADHIDLDWASIHTIHGFAFKDCHSVTSLLLTDTNPKYIKSFAFTGLNSVEELWFYEDFDIEYIKVIESFAFFNMTSLRILDLDHQVFTKLVSDTFAGLPALESLYLHGGYLEMIEPYAFSGCGNLTHLDLSENPLTTISTNAFTGLTSLTELDLSDLNIKHIGHSAFYGMDSLRLLDLSYNKINKLDAWTFSGLANLDNLDIHANRLFSISLGVFMGLEGLSTLHISTTHTLGSHSFMGMTSVVSLDLSNHDVDSIAPSAFSGLMSLKTVHLDDNPFTTLVSETFVDYITWKL